MLLRRLRRVGGSACPKDWTPWLRTGLAGWGARPAALRGSRGGTRARMPCVGGAHSTRAKCSGQRASACRRCAAQDLRGGATGARQRWRRLGRGERLRCRGRVGAASTAAFAEDLPAVTRQRDVRPAAQPVQGAGVAQAPHPRAVLLRPTRVALTAVEQHRGPYRSAAPQIVRDDPAQLREQHIAEHPAVGRGRAAYERGARPQPFVRVEHGDDSGRRLRGWCRACRPLTTSRGRATVGSRRRPIPRVRASGWRKRRTSTPLPRPERIRRSRSSLRLRAHTAGEVGFLGARTAAKPYRIGGRAVRERTSILPVELECGNEQLRPPTVIR